LREVSWELGFAWVPQQFACSVPGLGVPAGRGIPLLPDVPDGERRDGRPQRVIGREDAVIPVPVPPRLRDQICEPVQKLKGRKLDKERRRCSSD
jgi:hypothetical protein